MVEPDSYPKAEKSLCFSTEPFETKRKRGLSCYCYVTENKPTKKAFIGAHFTDMLDGRYVVSVTSKGGVAAARFRTPADRQSEVGKMIFSWSCEPNYFVAAPDNAFEKDEPVLSVMSLNDKYFGVGNAYLDNPKAYGYPHEALKDNAHAALVLLPEAPHTLLNLVQTHGAVAAFLARLFS